MDTMEWLGLFSVLLLAIFLFVIYSNKLYRTKIQLQKELDIVNANLITEKRQMNSAFAKSESQFANIINNFPEGIFIQVNGNFALVNPVLCDFMGFNDDKNLIGRSVLEFFHCDYHNEIKKRVHFLNDKKISFKTPLLSRLRKSDGSYFWCETTAVPIKFNGDNGAIVYLKNVSAKRDIEIELKNAGSTSEAVLNSLSASICVLNDQGVITSVNSNWKAFAESENGNEQTRLGVGLNYLNVCKNSAATGDKLAEQVLNGINDVLLGNSSNFSLEYPCHSPTEKRWFVMNVVPLQKDQLGVVISHQNNTEIKLSELERQESQRRFVNAFEHAPIGMAVVSLVGNILKVNPAFCFLLGYTDEDLLRKGMSDISFFEEYSHELELIKRMKRHELANSEMDRRFICKSGQIITCRLILSMVLDDQEKPSYFIYQFLDITENVKYLNSIEEQNKVLKEITWMQSHVVRAPLARLMALINALEETEEAEFPHQMVRDEVRNSANELDVIIREISNKAQQVNDLE